VAADGPLTLEPVAPAPATTRAPASRAVGFAGCLLAVVGPMLPLVSLDIRRDGPGLGPGEVRGADRNWYTFPGVGNAVLGLAVGGAVLLAAGRPVGAAAAGAGLVAFALPLPGQVTGGEFGWLGWCVVVVGGALLAGSGAAEARSP
jgi:hypothetical protein